MLLRPCHAQDRPHSREPSGSQMATVLRLRKPTLETDTSPPSQESLGDCGPDSATFHRLIREAEEVQRLY